MTAVYRYILPWLRWMQTGFSRRRNTPEAQSTAVDVLDYVHIAAKRQIGRIGQVGYGLSVFLLLAMAPCVSGAANTAQDEDLQDDLELNFEVVERDYEYRIEGRADPFVPFFTGEKNTSQEPDPNAIVESTERLTGMQLFEPGQLTLVALMKVQGAYIAMVEDFKGQGYIIREGTKIGRRGVVKDIASNKVVIEETAMTRAGKELRNEIVMALRKEGEE